MSRVSSRIQSFTVFVVISLSWLGPAASSFQEGEFVPTARRAQFHGVAVPLPHPRAQQATDDYKISFSFDHDRLVTHWLRIIGKHAPASPMVEIELTQRADSLVASKAKVSPVPVYYLRQHQLLVQEFQNSTHWPKHLLVRYHWTHSNALNINAALYALFGTGIVASIVLVVSVIINYQRKLQEFLSDLASESGQGEYVAKVD